MDIGVKLKVVKCYFENCETPTPESQKPPPTERPDTYQLWSEDSTWTLDSEKNLKSTANEADTKAVIPKENQDVIISEGTLILSSFKIPEYVG